MNKVMFSPCSRFLSKKKTLFFLTFALMIVSGWIPTESRAAFYYYEALIDVDNNPLTGGSVSVVQKNETPHSVNGIDYIVRVTFDDSQCWNLGHCYTPQIQVLILSCRYMK